MRRFTTMTAAIALLGLTACNEQVLEAVQTGAQNTQSAAAAVSPDLNAACGIAMTLAPAAPPIAPWIIGGCGTAEAITKLAADPNSLAWVDGLIAQAKTVKP